LKKRSAFLFKRIKENMGWASFGAIFHLKHLFTLMAITTTIGTDDRKLGSLQNKKYLEIIMTTYSPAKNKRRLRSFDPSTLPKKTKRAT
jgi:hypothetical protein